MKGKVMKFTKNENIKRKSKMSKIKYENENNP
jgi:hypothetical protein